MKIAWGCANIEGTPYIARRKFFYDEFGSLQLKLTSQYMHIDTNHFCCANIRLKM